MTAKHLQTAPHLSADHVRKLAEFCERHHVVRLWLFGSILRDDFRPDSDIDVLVEFDPAHIPAWEFFTMADELRTILGREVDLGTPNSLRPRIRDRVLAERQLIYERAG